MYNICGYTLPGSIAVSSSGGLAGCFVVHAPFIFQGETDNHNTLSVSAAADAENSLGIRGSVILPGLFTIKTEGTCRIINSLSAMNPDLVNTVFSGSMSVTGKTILQNGYGNKLAGRCIIPCIMGKNFARSAGISVPFGKTSLTGSCILSHPQTTMFFSNDTLRVLSGGKEITDSLISAEIELFGKGIASYKTLLRGEKNFNDITFIINGEPFRFKTESISVSAGKTEAEGTIQLECAEKNANIKAMKASDIAAEFSEKIVWAASDYVASDICGSLTGYEMAELLAQGAGHGLKITPDGHICVYGGTSPLRISADAVFSVKIKQIKNSVGSVTISYGRNSLYAEAESPAEPGRPAKLKIYGYYTGRVDTDADSVVLSSARNIETVTEEVFFSGGKAMLKKPPLSIITPVESSCGQEIALSGAYGTRTISYTSAYDEYLVHSSAQGKKTAEVYTSGSVTLFSGRKGENLNISLPHTPDRATAIKTALKYINDKHTAEIETTHIPLLSAPAGLFFSGGGIKGEVKSSKITIKNNPLIIKNILEVQL